MHEYLPSPRSIAATPGVFLELIGAVALPFDPDLLQSRQFYRVRWPLLPLLLYGPLRLAGRAMPFFFSTHFTPIQNGPVSLRWLGFSPFAVIRLWASISSLHRDFLLLQWCLVATFSLSSLELLMLMCNAWVTVLYVLLMFSVSLIQFNYNIFFPLPQYSP